MANLKKSFKWSALEQSGAKAVSLIVQIVLARLIAPEDFGILAILLVVTNIADSLAQSGFGSALIQKKDASPVSFSTAFWVSLAISCGLYILILAAAPFIAGFYQMPGIDIYLRVLGVVVIFNAVNSIQRSRLQKDMDFKALFKVSIISAILSGIVGIGLATAGMEIWALIVQVVMQSVVSCLLMWIVSGWRPRRTFVSCEAKELFSFGWKVCMTGILGAIYDGVSELVIGKVCSPRALGYYTQGRKYPIAVVAVLMNAIQNVLFPAYSSISDDDEAFRAMLRRTLILGSFFIMPVSLLLAVVAEPLIVILLTDKWLPCVVIFQLTCIPYCFLMVMSVNTRGYLAKGRSDIYLRQQTIKVILGLMAICTTAILTKDVYAIAAAFCLATLFNTLIIDCHRAGRVFGYGMFRQYVDIAPLFALSLVASLCASLLGFLGLSPLALLVLQTIVFVAVYLLGAFVVPNGTLRICRNETIKLVRGRAVSK